MSTHLLVITGLSVEVVVFFLYVPLAYDEVDIDRRVDTPSSRHKHVLPNTIVSGAIYMIMILI